MGILDIFKKDVEQKPIKLNIGSWMEMEYNDISVILANMLIEYRKGRGLRQQDLADILGCTKQFVVKLECAGVDTLDIRTLIEIWTKLSDKDYNFGSEFLQLVHERVNLNYNQLSVRRWGSEIK